MNRYGAMAEAHWRRWLPRRYRALPDPNRFFSTLGEEVAEEIGGLTLALAGDDPKGEDYLAKAGRLRMAQLQAEERVLREMVLLDPEPEMDEDDDQGPAQPDEGWIPLVYDPNHPFWKDATDDEVIRYP